MKKIFSNLIKIGITVISLTLAFPTLSRAEYGTKVSESESGTNKILLVINEDIYSSIQR